MKRNFTPKALLAGLLLCSSLKQTEALAWSSLKPPSFFNDLIPTTEPHPEFRKWCDSVGIRTPNLEHSSDTLDRVPGVVARSSLKQGEIAITLPVDACIVVLDSQKHVSPIPNLLSDASWSASHPKLRLACVLLAERAKGDASRYKGYVDHLPPVQGPGRERCDTLDRWTERELSMLQSPKLEAKTKERIATDLKWYSMLEKSDDTPTKEEFDWALDIVRTRAFGGDYSVPNNGEPNDIALLPWVDDLNHREFLRTENEQGVRDEPEESSHKQFHPVKLVLGRTRSAVCWVAPVAYNSGDEIAHSYLHGREGIAEDFLYEWGFTPAAKDMDAAELDVNGARVVFRGDGRIDELDSTLNLIRSSSDATTDAEVLRRIAEVCEEERLSNTDDDAAIDGDQASSQRREIAATFRDGKNRLLQAGSYWATCRADGR